MIPRSILATLGLGLALSTTIGCDRGPGTGDSPRAIVFVVLDNIRADRLSLCGYERPTSPYLESLARNGAAFSCEAKAPSTWTYPSHASFFTGAELPGHGAGMAEVSDGVEFSWGTRVKPLGPELPTLAEAMSARGYQTVLLSANPVLSPVAGLTRGFDVVSVAEEFEELYGPHLVRELTRLLAEEVADDGRPLFLFVNVCDAHQPWWKIPEGFEWLPERPRLSFNVAMNEGSPVRRRYTGGEMEPDEEAELLAHLSDVYDYAVWRADGTLSRILGTLREAGWLHDDQNGDHRVVVTSDHGELLGEHQLLGHEGPYMYEGLTKVPLLVFGSGTPPNLPSPVSATEAFSLVADGVLEHREVRSAAYASPAWARWFGEEIGGDPGAAIWDGTRKLVWQRGEFIRFDLATDPEEMTPSEIEEDPLVPDLVALSEAVVQSAEKPGASSPEFAEKLRALGYLN